MIKGFKKNGEILKYDYNALGNLPSNPSGGSSSGGAETFVIHASYGEGLLDFSTYTKMNVEESFEDFSNAINSGKTVVMHFTDDMGDLYILPVTRYQLTRYLYAEFCVVSSTKDGKLYSISARMCPSEGNGYMMRTDDLIG